MINLLCRILDIDTHVYDSSERWDDMGAGRLHMLKSWPKN